MGIVADWYAEETEIIHREATLRPVRKAQKLADRARRDRDRAEAELLAAALELQAEHDRLAAAEARRRLAAMRQLGRPPRMLAAPAPAGRSWSATARPA